MLGPADTIERLLNPPFLLSRAQILERPSPMPAAPGVYAWYFNMIPPGIDATDCHQLRGLKLLYVGISPSAPPQNGKAPSRQNLRKRLKYHFCGNAAGSTLRLTTGCLLSAQLGLSLRRVGRTERYTFTNPGERALDAWLEDHARVTWLEIERPWETERALLTSDLSLPLNISGGHASENRLAVTTARSAAKRKADLLPVVLDSGGPRRVSVLPPLA